MGRRIGPRLPTANRSEFHGRYEVSIKEVNAKLVQVKLALAVKTENRAKLAGSLAKQTSFKHQAAKFRREAADLARR
jgi:hypothetical protein